jgi:hypothetical protein
MVNSQIQDTVRKPANQGVRERAPEPNKITASTPYDFEAGHRAAAYSVDGATNRVMGIPHATRPPG